MLQTNLGDLRYAFASVTELDVKLKSFQYSPQFAQLVPASEPVIVVSYNVVSGERSDRATFMVPAEAMLDSLRAGERTEVQTEIERREALAAKQRVFESMQMVPVDVSVRLRPLTISPRDVINVQVGELIMLNHSVTRSLDVVVDGKVLAHAVAGANGRQLACQVVDFEENER